MTLPHNDLLAFDRKHSIAQNHSIDRCANTYSHNGEPWRFSYPPGLCDGWMVDGWVVEVDVPLECASTILTRIAATAAAAATPASTKFATVSRYARLAGL
jgi:hypothetical protein